MRVTTTKFEFSEFCMWLLRCVSVYTTHSIPLKNGNYEREIRHLTQRRGPTIYPLSTCSAFFLICFVWALYKTCSACVSHHHLSFFVSNLGAVFNGLAHVTLWGQASYAQYNDHDIFVFFRVKCCCCFVWFSSCNPVRVSSFRPKKRPRLLTQKIEPRDFRHLTKKWGPTFYPLSTCSAFLYKFCFVWAPW